MESAMDNTTMIHLLSSMLRTLLGPFLKLWRLLETRIHCIRLIEKIPGPFALPLMGNLLNVAFLDIPGIIQYAMKKSMEYNPILRFYVGPFPIVESKNPRDLEVILGSQKHLHKAVFYKFLKPWLGEGLLLSTGQKWKSRRKMLTPAFHFGILKQFVPIFNSSSEEFVNQLRTYAGGEAVDVVPLVKLLTLEVICETVMGVKINAQTGSNTEYVQAVNDISPIFIERGLRPWLYFDFAFNFSALGRRFNKCLEILHNTTDRVIQERSRKIEEIVQSVGTLDVDELGRRQRYVPLLDLMLLAARDGSLSDADIREEVDTFMFEGHDTTASAIAFTLFALSRHQHVQNKVLQELLCVFDASKSLQPTSEQLADLKYLEMVIKESLRLYPPVCVYARSINEDQELPSSQATLPAGCIFMAGLLTMQRSEFLFPDPEEFRPERFTLEECIRRHPFAYLPFSAGPRNCIGQRFAMLELKTVLAKIVWHYRILPTPDFEPDLSWEIILKSHNGILVRFEERGKN